MSHSLDVTLRCSTGSSSRSLACDSNCQILTKDEVTPRRRGHPHLPTAFNGWVTRGHQRLPCLRRSLRPDKALSRCELISAPGPRLCFASELHSYSLHSGSSQCPTYLRGRLLTFYVRTPMNGWYIIDQTVDILADAGGVSLCQIGRDRREASVRRDQPAATGGNSIHTVQSNTLIPSAPQAILTRVACANTC